MTRQKFAELTRFLQRGDIMVFRTKKGKVFNRTIYYRRGNTVGFLKIRKSWTKSKMTYYDIRELNDRVVAAFKYNFN